MDLTSNDGLILFDFNFPMYNWFYPMTFKQFDEKIAENVKNNKLDIFKFIGTNPKNRALYFHIPFCQDICSFCHFTREVCTDETILERYTDALVKEIQLKANYKNVSDFPINSIFFGGGTPSILKPHQILKIGQAIKDHFNLSQLKEFSFEMNAKTVTLDRVSALKEIGVTHPRMGVQSFNPKYRKLFSLSATLEQVVNGAELLNKHFNYFCIDMLYGMHGQTPDELIKDLHLAIGLGTPLIDVYPINNVVTLPKLNKCYKENNLSPSSGLTKLALNLLANEYMRHNGYAPHNGHGYVKVDQTVMNLRPVVTDTYRFQYHEAVYGYQGHEIIGFGSAAFSGLDRFSLGNCNKPQKYIDDLLNNSSLDMAFGEYENDLCESKGIVLHLPYHGEAEKEKINFDLVRPEIMSRLENSIKKGLITEDEKTYRLTQLGWYWYVNLLYYLAPSSDQERLRRMIDKASSDPDRFVEEWNIALNFLSFSNEERLKVTQMEGVS